MCLYYFLVKLHHKWKSWGYFSLLYRCLFDMGGSYNLSQYIYMYASHLDNLKKKNIHVKEVYLISMKKKISKIYFIIFHSKKFTGTIRDFLHRFEIGNVDIFSSFWTHKEYLARLLQCKIPVNSFIFSHVLALTLIFRIW